MAIEYVNHYLNTEEEFGIEVKLQSQPKQGGKIKTILSVIRHRHQQLEATVHFRWQQAAAAAGLYGR